ncbi:MAG: endonuclease/exonuclease/phosphatase family protein [Paludibacter sp.]
MANSTMQKHLPNHPNGVIEYLLSTNADIICIQEYNVSRNKNYLTPEDIDALFKNYTYKYIKFDCDNFNSITGLATFSKYPIIKNERIKYESIFNASIYSDIVIDKDTIRVVNNHLESNRFTGNDLLLARQLKHDFNSSKLINTTKYFSQKLGVAYPVRAKQADKIHEVIASTPYKLIVCGDFNDVPISYSYTKIRGELNDAYVNCGTGFGWTFDSSIYKLRLDYVFYDNHFEVQDFQIGKNKSSDHFPIKCVLRIK